MNVFTRIAAAALIGTGFAAAASAEEWIGARVVGSGENASVVYSDESGNIVGGALTRVVGSGEGATVEVIEAPFGQAPRAARTVGSGENQTIVYEPIPAMRLVRAGQQG